MKKYTVFRSVTAAPATAKSKLSKDGSVLKLGLDIHQDKLVVVAQYDHATPRPPQGFAPAQFVPWVEARLREGFQVHVVYESCGLGYGLYRVLLKAGAHCYVIAPQKLDERNTRVKTDGREVVRSVCAWPLPGRQYGLSGSDPGAKRRRRADAALGPPA